MEQMPLGMRLADRAVFASFHGGDNAAAVAWLREFATPGAHGAGVVTGGAGSGKSHLLQATCAAAGGVYFPLRELRELGPGVLEGMASRGMACVDDLQLVAGDPAWERALFGLYLELERDGRLLLASDPPPALLPFGLPDLASRLAAATTFVLQRLDEAGQREALRLRAQLRGLELPEETALWLQRRYPRDMASLHRLLDTLDLASLREQRRLTVPFIRAVLGDVPPPAPPPAEPPAGPAPAQG